MKRKVGRPKKVRLGRPLASDTTTAEERKKARRKRNTIAKTKSRAAAKKEKAKKLQAERVATTHYGKYRSGQRRQLLSGQTLKDL